LLAIYPDLIRASISMSQTLAGSLGKVRLESIRPDDLQIPVFANLGIKLSLTLSWAFEWFKYLAYLAINFLTTFGVALMVMLFPIVIFSSQMLNFAVAWPLFIGTFLVLCLWPLFWNLVGFAATLYWAKADKTIGDQIYTLFFTVMQVFSPLIGAKLLSGQSIGRSISGAISTLVNPSRQAIRAIGGTWDGFTRSKDNYVGSSMGKKASFSPVGVAGWGTNQILSRSKNASLALRSAPSESGGDLAVKGRSVSSFHRARQAAKGFILNEAPDRSGPGTSQGNILVRAGRSLTPKKLGATGATEEAKGKDGRRPWQQ
jgi:hypothetical protein